MWTGLAGRIQRVSRDGMAVDAVAELGARGERAVARGRIAIVGILCTLSLLVLVTDPGNAEAQYSAAANLASLGIAWAILQVAQRPDRPRGFAWFTCLYDVSIISLLHYLDVLRDTPSVAVNGRVTFMVYFFALVATIVRWDRRLCLAAGAVAVVQYLGVVALSWASWPTTPTPDVVAHGQFDWAVQIERVVTLLAFAWICHNIARWAVELRASATHDQLTGLMNRLAFHERLGDELLRARRVGQPMSVAMIDVDRFKDVNDRYGHLVGDDALRHIARVLRDGVRRTDLVARWGGEEFAVVFPDTDEHDALLKVEGLRSMIATSPVILGTGATIALTVSAGLASSADGLAEPDPLMELADSRLLAAKRQGKNRVITREMAAIAS